MIGILVAFREGESATTRLEYVTKGFTMGSLIPSDKAVKSFRQYGLFQNGTDTGKKDGGVPGRELVDEIRSWMKDNEDVITDLLEGVSEEYRFERLLEAAARHGNGYVVLL